MKIIPDFYTIETRNLHNNDFLHIFRRINRNILYEKIYICIEILHLLRSLLFRKRNVQRIHFVFVNPTETTHHVIRENKTKKLSKFFKTTGQQRCFQVKRGKISTGRNSLRSQRTVFRAREEPCCSQLSWPRETRIFEARPSLMPQ